MKNRKEKNEKKKKKKKKKRKNRKTEKNRKTTRETMASVVSRRDQTGPPLLGRGTESHPLFSARLMAMVGGGGGGKKVCCPLGSFATPPSIHACMHDTL